MAIFDLLAHRTITVASPAPNHPKKRCQPTFRTRYPLKWVQADDRRGLRNRISMSYRAMCSVKDSSRVLMPFQTIWAPIQTRRNDESFVITDIPVGPRTRASRSANP
jgi:hypothetical protein